MSSPNSGTHVLVYFMDCLFCLFFGMTLALVQARFSREQTVPVELPKVLHSGAPGAVVDAPEVAVRVHGGSAEIHFEGQVLDLEGFEGRLRNDPPPVLIFRPEGSVLARIIAVAHATGVRHIRIAYEPDRAEGEIQ